MDNSVIHHLYIELYAHHPKNGATWGLLVQILGFSFNHTLRNPFIYSWLYSTSQLLQTSPFSSRPLPNPITLPWHPCLCSGITFSLSDSDTQSTLILPAAENRASLLPKTNDSCDWPWTAFFPTPPGPCISHQTLSLLHILSASSSQFFIPH